MKTNFKLQTILGTVYKQGNPIFTSDGTCVLSPIGSRVAIFDLVNNKSEVFSFSHECNIICIALNPQGNILLSLDETGKLILASVRQRLPLHHFSLNSSSRFIAFSPDGQYFAVANAGSVEIWCTPKNRDVADEAGLDFAPFIRHRSYSTHHDVVNSITWSSDSRFIVTASADLTARVLSINPEAGFIPTCLTGHRESLVRSWFSSNQEKIFTISKDGALFEWAYTSPTSRPEPEDVTEGHGPQPRWQISERHFCMQTNASVTCVEYHASTALLAVGFSNGIFTLYQMPNFDAIHTISISQYEVDFVHLNSSGEWLALGSSRLGQLLVWEWKSESYVLKQQGHHDTILALTYSPDGRHIITTADDGKIKLWDARTGFCIITFTEHTGAVTACLFAKKGHVLYTASLDGSVRAWDLIRYRNFKIFTAPSRISFSSLAIDPSGEIVCAGSHESFEIHVWSVQTGQLLDRLSGHEGPVVTLAFASSGDLLLSGSWDRTVRMWSLFSRTQQSESIHVMSDILAIAFRPDSKQFAVSTLDGQLTFWSSLDSIQEGVADGRRDLSGGRRAISRQTAARAAGTKSFSSLVYSADGDCLVAGGDSKNICVYNVQSCLLIQKFTISINRSLDGAQEFLNSASLTEGGAIHNTGTHTPASKPFDSHGLALPGATRGDFSTRSGVSTIRVAAIAISPDGEAFCAASSEGLLVYNIGGTSQFDPLNLDVDATPVAALDAISNGHFRDALTIAFRLREDLLITHVYQTIPLESIKLVVDQLPRTYIATLIKSVIKFAGTSPQIELVLRWVEIIFAKHGSYMKAQSSAYGIEVRGLRQILAGYRKELAVLTETNLYNLDYLLSQHKTTSRYCLGSALEKITDHIH